MLPVTRERIKSLYGEAMRHMAAGRTGRAEEGFAEVARSRPDLAEAHYQLGRIARGRGDRAGAVAHLRRAEALKPSEPAVLTALIDALGEAEEVLPLHDRLIALTPKSPGARADKALYLQRLGDFDAAEGEFRRAIKAFPHDAELYRIFLATKKLPPGDPLIRAMQRLWADRRLNAAGRMHLGYALAKAMEDTGARDRVFGYLREANRLQRKAQPYDRAAREAEVEALLAAMEGADFKAAAGSGAPAPILVTGLPRSGTTLVERILSSHPQVAAGGEIGAALKLAFAMLRRDGALLRFGDVPAERRETFRTAYRGALARAGGGAPRVTDKSIHNHLIFGPLHSLVPGGRIIRVKRDPRDVALSIYKNHFEGGAHRYATDLGDIAHQIALTERVVAFWKARLPGAIHEIAYESLVADPEGETRRLIAAAGLDWDESCLSPHTGGGAVRTLSLHQVRQPIYRSSAEAWRAHEADLAPFFEVWREETG